MAMSDIIPWRSSRGELTRRGDPLSYVQSQINRMFDDLWSGAQWPAETGRMFSPQVEIKETDKEIQVCAELPGIESKDLDVNLSDNELNIRGEKRSERESDEKGRYWSERTYGSFERTIPLPTEVDGDKAKSEFKNGVLRITLPKRKGAKPRALKIAVT